MAKDAKIGELIEKLRDQQGMTQAQFAEAIGASQGRLSEWESGVTIPSAEGYVKLAAQAAKSDPDRAFFFWTQAGLQPDAVISVADLLLKKGEVNMDAILATAEQKLNDRMGDQGQMANEGKVVLVPPFPEGASVAERPVLAVPSLLVPNKALIYYIVGQSDPLDIARRGFAPGDFIFFDASETGTGEILERLIGEELLVRLTAPSTPHAAPGAGLFIGRPGFLIEYSDKGPEHMALWPPDVPPPAWDHPHGLLAMAKIGGSWAGSVAERRRQSQKPHLHHIVYRDWYEYSECQVLGKVLGRFNAGTVELWKRQAQRQ